MIAVIWQYTGLTPKEMDARVTTYSQYSISANVNDIRNMEAQTLSGLSVIKIFFQPNVNVDLAIAQRSASQLDLAKETLVKALTIAPRHPAAHYNLGQLYDQTNEPAHAVEHYRTFLETAGAEHAARAAAVRARIAALSRTPE